MTDAHSSELSEMRNYFLLIKSFVNITEYPLSYMVKDVKQGHEEYNIKYQQ